MADQVAESVERPPAPPLRPFVDSYVGYRYEGFAPGIHAGLPSRHLTFVVPIGAPLEMAALPDPAQQPSAFSAPVGGLHAAPAAIRHDGNQFGVQLQVTPMGARALFGIPASAVAAGVVELSDLVGRCAAELVERVNEAATWAERFAALDDFLSRRLGEPPSVRDKVACAWHRILQTHGSVDVASLAREVGWSRRHLAQRFRAEYGLSPKQAARVLRFERSRWMLTRGAGTNLASIAAECGYADHAHMTREWHELAGASPTGWLAAEELPIVQDRQAGEG